MLSTNTPRSRFILITGCSGGGKSSLIDALSDAGYPVVPEPGRRVIAEARDTDGATLPWRDPVAFARRAAEMAEADLALAPTHSGAVFFDRGLIDAAVALTLLTGEPLSDTLGSESPYDDPVFLAPPWRALFQTDTDRRHGFKEAVAEYDRLTEALDVLGHEVVPLPKTDLPGRLAFVENQLV